ncbi:MAG TPA: GFA family protein [Oleiagrimonas sp.]|nr:GFA family protein [Oleiagrimonas sp.]
MHRGSCLCGAITYTIHGELGPLAICHCSKCRKANGSAFLAAAQVSPDEFVLDDPQHYLKSFESSPGVFRTFCGNCGSPLFSRRPGPPEVLRLRVGTLDTKLSQTPELHIFCADKAEWYEPDDAAPRFPQGPPP